MNHNLLLKGKDFISLFILYTYTPVFDGRVFAGVNDQEVPEEKVDVVKNHGCKQVEVHGVAQTSQAPESVERVTFLLSNVLIGFPIPKVRENEGRHHQEDEGYAVAGDVHLGDRILPLKP